MTTEEFHDIVTDVEQNIARLTRERDYYRGMCVRLMERELELDEMAERLPVG